MSDIDLVVTASRELEQHLKSRYGAVGSGLGEMVHSLNLPSSTRASLLRINQIRNRLVHEPGASLASLGLSQADFRALLTQAEYALEIPGQISRALLAPASGTRERPLSAESDGSSRNRQFSSSRPWYRSTGMMIVWFLVVPPLWILLLLTDGQQGCGTKLFATAFFAIEVVVMAPLWSYLPVSGFLIFESAFPQAAATMRAPLATILPGSAPVLASPPAWGATPTVRTTSTAACTVVWAPAPQVPVAGRTRANVWEEFVSTAVAGSGMTSREFYDSVVERNPTLAQDGFVFADDQVYVLPTCP